MPMDSRSTAPLLSVVIPAANERQTIGRVIEQAKKIHSSCEIIVVANGCNDGTTFIARKQGARVLQYGELMGHDVGRSVGAAHANGRILLFLDADIVIPAYQLRRLVNAVEQGVDVALNRYMGPTKSTNIHNVVLAKHVLNIALSRPDLEGASMTTIPHALSRRALEEIGVETLSVPPLAHAVALSKGLRVEAVHFINVGSTNPLRRRKVGRQDPLEGLILGDHLEALHSFLGGTDERGFWTDLMRNRAMIR